MRIGSGGEGPGSAVERTAATVEKRLWEPTTQFETRPDKRCRAA
jgi:hypothetical protein